VSPLRPVGRVRGFRRILGMVGAAWRVGCVAGLVLLIGARWFRYTRWAAIPGLDGLLREIMVLDAQAFLWPWVYTLSELRIVLLALATVVVALHRRLPGQLVRRVDGVWRLTPLAVSLLLAGMLWSHYAFDLNPTVATVCATALVLTLVVGHRRTKAALPKYVPAVVWCAFFAASLIAARDSTDRITIVVWAIVLLATHRLLGPRMAGPDLLLLRTAAVIPMSLLAATLPLFVPLHGGVRLGDGLAYDFCEIPGRGTLYATVPVCGSVWASYEDCRGGRVVEYSLNGMKRIAEHNFFSPDFYGRLELIECLDDEVQVAVQAAVIHRHKPVQTALAFPVANPNTFNPLAAGENMGITIAYDRAHAGIFYTGEFTHRVARYDRRTGRLEDIPGQELSRRWIQPVTLREYSGSSVLYTNSIHRGRNRIYLAEWMQGRYAYAIDLTTLRVVDRYDVGGGGALGITVDEARDRLFVSSLWGLEVFDLTTDTLITRKRTGLGNRPVIVDAARNRLYLGSMVEGKIRVLDRDTFEVIGQIPIGLGGRFAHLSLDGKYLVASSATAHYYWDADTLVPPR
jgi:hypothetical protein